MKRFLLAAAVAVTVAAPAAAAPYDTANGVPSNWQFHGVAAYTKSRPFTLQTAADGRSVQVAPGYFQLGKRCNRNANGAFDADFLPDARKLALDDRRAFSGFGQRRVRVGRRTVTFSWTVQGRFATAKRAGGTLSISAVSRQRNRKPVRCPQQTVTWTASPAPVTADWYDFPGAR